MRKNLKDIKINIIHFKNYKENNEAILHRFNCYIRVLDGNNKEHFFNEFHNALKYLMDRGYLMEIDI